MLAFAKCHARQSSQRTAAVLSPTWCIGATATSNSLHPFRGSNRLTRSYWRCGTSRYLPTVVTQAHVVWLIRSAFPCHVLRSNIENKHPIISKTSLSTTLYSVFLTSTPGCRLAPPQKNKKAHIITTIELTYVVTGWQHKFNHCGVATLPSESRHHTS